MLSRILPPVASAASGRAGAPPRRRRLLGAAVTAALVWVSAPAVPAGAATPGGFADTASGAFYGPAVDSLAARGVFAGTGCPDGFCPGDELDRATMAVWTVRVVDGKDPAAAARPRFSDVGRSRFEARFIERFAALGITSGCGDGTRFCPDRAVTRAEMAVFLARAFTLDHGRGRPFRDVPVRAWYGPAVEEISAASVTSGCGDGTRFCPDRAVTRAEMAVFLARAADLLEPPEPPPDLPTVRAAYRDSEGRMVIADLDGYRVDAVTVEGAAGSPDGPAPSFGWSPDHSRLAYLDGEGRLHTVYADGTGGARVTGVETTWWSWSADGDSIAYVHRRERPIGAMWVADPDGGNRVWISFSTANVSRGSVSPDGTRYAFILYNGELWVWDDFVYVRPSGATPHANVQRVAWSADGARLAFEDWDGSLWVVGTDGAAFGGEHETISIPWMSDWSRARVPGAGDRWSWSPSGARLAYEDFGGSLWVAGAGGDAPVRVSGEGHVVDGWSWSPSGARLAYEDFGGSLWVAGAGGDAPVRVSGEGGDVGGWSWSPYGDRLVYDGGGRLRVVGADGTGRQSAALPAAAKPRDLARESAWSADSSGLVFTSEAGDCAGGGAPDACTPRISFWYYDLATRAVHFLAHHPAARPQGAGDGAGDADAEGFPSSWTVRQW